MNTRELLQLLEQNSDSPLHLGLPSGEFIPAHFHVTEVGFVHKQFIDCGGTCREFRSCVIQVWTANDLDHRLTAGKLSKILRLAERTFGTDDLPVEIEYGPEVAAHYFLSDVESTPSGLLLNLVGKQTDCLARDKCGVGECQSSDCCS